MVEVNWVAVLIGTIGYMVLGALWYGPLFGSLWMRSMGYEGPEDVETEAETQGYVLTSIGSLVAVGSLAVLVDWVGATTWESGMALGAIIGVGFVATTALQTVPFEGRAWPTYVLNVGYNLVALTGIGVLIAVW